MPPSPACRALIADNRLDFVIVNGENAAGGFGITEEILKNVLDAGADVVTTGNHAFDQREALVFAARQERFLRPVNFPAGTPGHGAGVYIARNGARVLVINAMGRVFMEQLDDPFAAVEREIAACPLGEQADAIIVDFHAEATQREAGASATISTAASAWWSAPIPMCRPRTIAFCPAAPPSRPTSACAATTIRSSA